MITYKVIEVYQCDVTLAFAISVMESFDESTATADQPVDVLIANGCSQWDKENG